MGYKLNIFSDDDLSKIYYKSEVAQDSQWLRQY